MFNYNVSTMIIKYFLPGNKKALITVSKDKNLQYMVSFLGDANTGDVFDVRGRSEITIPTCLFNLAHKMQKIFDMMSSRTTVSEGVVPIVAPIDVIVDAVQCMD
ncbi:hypothetical protein CR513_56129, partial [Mucuna pruriens]